LIKKEHRKCPEALFTTSEFRKWKRLGGGVSQENTPPSVGISLVPNARRRDALELEITGLHTGAELDGRRWEDIERQMA